MGSIDAVGSSGMVTSPHKAEVISRHWCPCRCKLLFSYEFRPINRASEIGTMECPSVPMRQCSGLMIRLRPLHSFPTRAGSIYSDQSGGDLGAAICPVPIMIGDCGIKGWGFTMPSSKDGVRYVHSVMAV